MLGVGAQSAVLRGSSGMLGIVSELTTCKANALPMCYCSSTQTLISLAFPFFLITASQSIVLCDLSRGEMEVLK